MPGRISVLYEVPIYFEAEHPRIELAKESSLPFVPAPGLRIRFEEVTLLRSIQPAYLRVGLVEWIAVRDGGGRVSSGAECLVVRFEPVEIPGDWYAPQVESKILAPLRAAGWKQSDD